MRAPHPPRRHSAASASFYLPSSYEKGDKQAHATRLTITLGLPLKGYSDANDRFEEQEAKINAWVATLWPKAESLRKEYEKNGGPMAMMWVVGFDVLSSYFFSILTVDIRFAIAALYFVVAYTAYHTGSAFVAGISMIGVVLCFGVGAFWMIVISSVPYFDPLNIFLLFVLLG